MSGEGWREPDTGSSGSAGRGAPRDADPYAPPADPVPGPAGQPGDGARPDHFGLPGHGAPPHYGTAPVYGAPPAHVTPPVYGTPPAQGSPPGYGSPGVPPQGYGGPPYAPSPGQPYGYPPYGYAAPPQRTSGMAIASLVLGLVWIYWIGSILAVIFGHLALSETRRDPRVGGRGLAIAGLVLGYIGLGVLVIGLVALAVDGASSVG